MADLRPIRFYDNLAHIELTQGLTAVIDAEDAFLVAHLGWHARNCGDGLFYAITNGYQHADGRRGSIQMHRLILNAPAGILVDHRDGNGLHNRKLNLRLATHAQNARNKPAHRNNKSGVKGVHWSARDKRWIALITHDGQKERLGSFLTVEEAAAAYQAAAIRLHGPFAWGAGGLP